MYAPLLGLSVALGTVVAYAGGAPATDPRRLEITICLVYGEPAPEMDYARAITASILRKAGIQLRWRLGVPECGNVTGLRLIIAEIVTDAPPDVPSNVRARSFLSGQASRIILYRRRVMNHSCPATCGFESGMMMGHVLAHEITHVLQGFGHHGDTGLMRARWTAEDIYQMQSRTLSLAAEDVELIWEAVDRER